MKGRKEWVFLLLSEKHAVVGHTIKKNKYKTKLASGYCTGKSRTKHARDLRKYGSNLGPTNILS